MNHLAFITNQGRHIVDSSWEIPSFIKKNELGKYSTIKKLYDIPPWLELAFESRHEVLALVQVR